MFGLSKLYTNIALALAGAVAVSGIFMGGVFYGKSTAELKEQRSEMLDYLAQVNTGFNIVDDFARIAKLAAEQVQAAQISGTETIRLGKDYVRKNPPPVAVTVDPYLLQLRSCQIDEANRALGHQLPRERAGATCPPPLPGNQ